MRRAGTRGRRRARLKCLMPRRRRAPVVRTLALVALALLLAGCSQPAPAPAEGPLDLSGSDGLLLLDLESRSVVPISATATRAWISPSGEYLTWAEPTYNVVQTPQGRVVAPLATWARVFDNGTGYDMAPGVARLRHLVNATAITETPLPPTDRTWTLASEDLSVLGGEFATSSVWCAHEIRLRTQNATTFPGCHLAIAADGRAGWTTGPEVRVRHTNGTIERITAPEGSTAENPVFTANGVLYLRLHGDDTDLLAWGNETALAKTHTPRKLALHGATDDGRYLLLASFRP